MGTANSVTEGCRGESTAVGVKANGGRGGAVARMVLPCTGTSAGAHMGIWDTSKRMGQSMYDTTSNKEERSRLFLSFKSLFLSWLVAGFLIFLWQMITGERLETAATMGLFLGFIVAFFFTLIVLLKHGNSRNRGSRW